MATKWADYVITAVRFNQAGTQMIGFAVSADTGAGLKAKGIWTFKEVAQALLKGETFVTAMENSYGSFAPGAPVELHLKAGPAGSAVDSLKNLPRC